jgi:subtilisin family serine protease
MNQSSIRRIPIAAAFALLIALVMPLALAGAQASRGKDLAPPLPPSLQGLKPDSKSAEDEESARIPGEYIVVFKTSVSAPASLAQTQVASKDGELGFVYRHALKGYSAELSKEAVRELRNDPRVRYVEPNYEIETFAQTIPTGIERIEATKNALADIDGIDDARVNVDVAVIDSGVELEKEKQSDLNVAGRVDCTSGKCIEGVGYDSFISHGTHVAGTIGAIDNGEGVVGVAPGARIWSVRVFDENGKGTTATSVAGIDWVTGTITDGNPANDIEVANMSFGCRCEGTAHQNAISGYKEGEKEVLGMVDRGIVPVAAAGNSTADASFFSPARNPDAITVAALADADGKAGGSGSETENECDRTTGFEFTDDTLAPFSNYGDVVDIAAPGMCIFSTVTNTIKYWYMSGTSMAAPHVTGAAALLAAKSNPNSQADVEAIRSTLVQGGNLTWDDTYVETGPEPLLDVSDAVNGTEAATGQAYPTRPTGATLNGRIDPNGQSTTYKFEYGTTTAYGQSMPASPKSVGSGSAHVAATETINGLKPETTYHFRLVATTSKGTINGADRTFKTAPWAGKHAPNPGGYLSSLSCRNRDLCVAAGWQHYHGEAYFAEWDGKAWMKAPAEWSEWDRDAPLDVECAEFYSPTDWECIAVGYSYKEEGLKSYEVPYIAETYGSSPASWNLEPLGSLDGDKYTWLGGVSCAGTVVYEGEGEEDTFCMAVGRAGPDTGTAGLLSMSRDAGGNWKVLSTVSGEMAWEDVSCASPSACVAVGYHGSTARWDGSKWTLQTAATDGRRTGVSCPTAEMCIAVGWRVPKSEAREPVAELWNGKAWSLLSVPASEADKVTVSDVECVTSVDCTATYQLSDEIVEGVPQFGFETEASTLRWDGKALALQTAGFAPKRDTGLSGLACLPDSRCMGTGYQLGGDAPLMLSRSWYAPTATTNSASAISHSKATLNASVDPEGLATSYQFEYGTTTAYGSKAPASPKATGSGSVAVAVSESIAGLVPNTTYHYRITATNAEGTSYGQNQTFQTTLPHVPLLEAEKYPASISGPQVTQHKFQTVGGHTSSCTKAQFSASATAATSSLSVSPAMSSCTALGQNATWNMNSCSYKHNILNSGPPYTATMDIVCSKAGDEIVIASGICTIRIPAQSGLKGIALSNSGSGSERAVTATYSITGITYKKVGITCPGNGGASTVTLADGAYTGSTKLSGLDGEGKADGVYLSGGGTQGLFVAGKESGEEASKPKLEAEKYPAAIGGPQVTQHKFDAGGNTSCTKAQFSASATAATSSLSVSPALSSCVSLGQNATWNMNSCSYKHNILNSGPPYTATMDIVCSKAGDEIVIASGICTIRIPAQSGLKGIALANSGAGSERAVTATYSITGISYKKVGITCPGNGGASTVTYADGAYTGSTTLRGFN